VSSQGTRLASDAQLVVAIGRFRHDALAEVYRHHTPAAFGLARRITAFRVRGPVAGFAITQERAPVAVSPENPPVAQGSID
jgi:hypothetical protein